jgi:hypothetical protein
MVSFDEPIENAWVRSHGRCECRRGSHRHQGRCNQALIWQQRGRAGHGWAWEAHHSGSQTVGGWEAVQQCEILCWECYRRTLQTTPRSRADNSEAAAR